MTVTIRPTVSADLAQVVGEPLPFRIRAITVLDDTRVLGIGGIGYAPDNAVIAFVQQAPDAKRYPVSFHRAGLAAMQMVRDAGIAEVHASASTDDPAAVRWLMRLGFGLVAVSGGKALFIWRR